jgi:hypothetical protein
MRTHHLPLVLVILFVGCMRPSSTQPTPAGGDRTIAFPQFFEHDAIAVGATGGTYELDGETLRAIMLAANDFLPPGNQPRPCHKRQEAQFYRVIRRENIIFVDIRENPEYCDRRSPTLDSGAKYAVSIDGRILRHVLDGAEGGPFDTGTTKPLSREEEFIGELGSSPTFDAGSPSELGSSQDGGLSSSDSGIPSAPARSDGGLPEAP